MKRACEEEGVGTGDEELSVARSACEGWREVQVERREGRLGCGVVEGTGETARRASGTCTDRGNLTVRTSSSSAFPSTFDISSSLLSPVRSISTLSLEPRAFASFAGEFVPSRAALLRSNRGVEAEAGRDEVAWDLAGLRKGEGEAREEGSLTSRFFGVGSLW